jgi:hypothetical protein
MRVSFETVLGCGGSQSSLSLAKERMRFEALEKVQEQVAAAYKYEVEVRTRVLR